MEKYTDKSIVLEDIAIDKEGYEYVEYQKLYQNKIESMIEFLTKKNSENSYPSSRLKRRRSAIWSICCKT